MHPLAALVLGSILLLRTRAMLKDPGPARSLWTSLAALELAEVLQVEPVRRRVETAARVDGLAGVLRHGLALVAAGGVRSLLNGVTAPQAQPVLRRPHVVLGVAGLTALMSPFAIVGPSQAPLVATGLSGRRDRPAVASVLVSWTGYLMYLSWALGGSSRLCWTYSRQAPPGPTRTGLVLTGAGTTAGFGYVALKLAALRSWARDEPHDLLGDVTRAQPAVVLVVLVLVSVGSGYEALHDRTASYRNTRQARQSLRRLFPLWQLVHELAPTQVLFPYHRAAPRLGGTQTTRFLDLRRRTEIQDGLRVLCGYIDAHAHAAALSEAQRHAKSGADASALAAAACLHLARLRLQAQQPVHPPDRGVTLEKILGNDAGGPVLERVSRFLTAPATGAIARGIHAETVRPASDNTCNEGQLS